MCSTSPSGWSRRTFWPRPPPPRVLVPAAPPRRTRPEAAGEYPEPVAWWAGVVIWLVLVVWAGVVLFLLGRSVYRKAKLLFREVGDASDRLAVDLPEEQLRLPVHG